EKATAQSRGAPGNRVEHRLHVSRRARNDPEDLRGRCLLLQGVDQFTVSRLQLLEQADVLDGDHGLVRKRPEKRDLGVGERPWEAPCTPDHTNGGALGGHRYRQYAAPAAANGHVLEIVGVGKGVVDVYESASQDGSSRCLYTTRPHRIDAAHE